MNRLDPVFETRLASGPQDIEAAARLRYAVFVQELGGDGPLVDHRRRLEIDRFDPFFEHLLLLDRARDADDQVIGLYRMMRAEGAEAAGQFYSEDEYDLAPLRASGRRLMELGRSCLHPDYRGGEAMYHLWRGLAEHAERHAIEVMFGVASFHGTDPSAHAAALSLLHHRHLAPPELRARSRAFRRMDLLAPEAVDARAALMGTPALIKAYLRLGGWVGEGAFVDAAFNTVDICLILDTARMNARQAALYTKARAP